MKTATIKLLKKPVLVVELPEQGFIFRRGGLDHDCYMVRNNITNEDFFINDYVMLGKPDEIREEDVDMMVEAADIIGYKNYKGEIGLNTAIESFFSAIESEIFWMNPFLDSRNAEDLDQHLHDWMESELLTFDRNRTLIFIES